MSYRSTTVCWHSFKEETIRPYYTAVLQLLSQHGRVVRLTHPCGCVLDDLLPSDVPPSHPSILKPSPLHHFVSGEVDHLAQDCPTYGEMQGVYKEQCNTLGIFQKPYSPYSNTYNPGWRNHPTFSWKAYSNNHA